MNALYIEGTDDSPKIVLDREKNLFEISGKSLPEDVSSFFEPVLNWFEEYQQDPLEETNLDIKLSYFNTASSKLLLDIFMLLEQLKEMDKKVMINWFYPHYDEEMKEAGIEYSEMVDLEFNFILEN
jgi:hypothetical protein